MRSGSQLAIDIIHQEDVARRRAEEPRRPRDAAGERDRGGGSPDLQRGQARSKPAAAAGHHRDHRRGDGRPPLPRPGRRQPRHHSSGAERLVQVLPRGRCPSARPAHRGRAAHARKRPRQLRAATTCPSRRSATAGPPCRGRPRPTTMLRIGGHAAACSATASPAWSGTVRIREVLQLGRGPARGLQGPDGSRELSPAGIANITVVIASSEGDSGLKIPARTTSRSLKYTACPLR